jgi:hypothetical protein
MVMIKFIKMRARSSGFKSGLNPSIDRPLNLLYCNNPKSIQLEDEMICRRAWSLLPSRYEFFDKRDDRMTVVLSPVFFVLTPPYLQSSCRDSGCSYTQQGSSKRF